jgi:fructokinase
MYGGIETGGTKTVCAVGHDGTISHRIQFPTGEDPVALADTCARFFANHAVEALGVGTFGPCDPDPRSDTYGHLLSTPKPGFAHVDLLGLLAARIDVPIRLTTDVTAAVLGEARYGAAFGFTDVVYVTIGTGIGGGVISGGQLLHGAQHPEVGHMLLPVDSRGICPFHAGCWEGVASGPALQARLGVPATDLTDDDPAWLEQARIVASGVHNLTCVLSPQMVIIGGGVGSRDGLHCLLPDLVQESLGGYLPMPRIVKPALGSDAGVIGALTLAQMA